jgi:hypothetical protein
MDMRIVRLIYRVKENIANGMAPPYFSLPQPFRELKEPLTHGPYSWAQRVAWGS